MTGVSIFQACIPNGVLTSSIVPSARQSWALSVFFNFFNNKKWFFAFFIRLIWLGVGFLNRTGAEIGFKRAKKCKQSFFIIEKIQKYRKSPALGRSQRFSVYWAASLSWSPSWIHRTCLFECISKRIKSATFKNAFKISSFAPVSIGRDLDQLDRLTVSRTCREQNRTVSWPRVHKVQQKHMEKLEYIIPWVLKQFTISI